MSGQPSGNGQKARAAFEKSGGTLSPKELMKKYKVSQSTAYRICGPKKQQEPSGIR